jgi:Tfp pilus assembly protein PilO
MGARGRLIAIVAVAVLIVLAVWLLLVAPERNKANSLSAQITAEQAALSTAQGSLNAAEQAKVGYANEVHSIKTLEVAVPTSDQIPQLISTINGLEVNHHVNYTSTSLSPGSAGGFNSLGLSFNFDSTYVNLQEFLGAFAALTLTNGTSVLANGRLVSIGSISLGPGATNGVSATVSMTAYQEVPGVGATTPTGTTTTPTGATGPA